MQWLSCSSTPNAGPQITISLKQVSQKRKAQTLNSWGHFTKVYSCKYVLHLHVFHNKQAMYKTGKSRFQIWRLNPGQHDDVIAQLTHCALIGFLKGWQKRGHETVCTTGCLCFPCLTVLHLLLRNCDARSSIWSEWTSRHLSIKKCMWPHLYTLRSTVSGDEIPRCGGEGHRSGVFWCEESGNADLRKFFRFSYSDCT